MKSMTFDWDTKKASQNMRKHKVSFEEASSVFFDEHAIEFFDPGHSIDEDRFLMLGLSFRLRLLVVVYCIREKNRQVRIISARKATTNEQKAYKRK
ncbi:MAG: BrnT family toxin [Sedimentisphaerales bacterium]|nr:BrnT family toxin [Sedimentisphaerales bacterium]